MRNETKPIERRTKSRFPIHREFRYKILEDDTMEAAGGGETLDISSSGVSLYVEDQLPLGAFIEVSISWPVMLGESCAMRLIVFGRVVRSEGRIAACTIDKYEFRTQARKLHIATPIRSDSMLQRWADGWRKDTLKTRAAVGA
jgi:hypothetical protein